ncbi:hypothetical protein [Kushneria phosphatilytica]|uniref:Uncharacterized protein n=1 Tax=Kushneria phosphatilytica TaxID=657387 RepID=A0A1S1NZ82_9GAMM|nr:hypothetical protein [Kushneria phosphatilytica]OHV12183.1 hypothetical protein BH688_05905 [Kushneria phosphatilytica]QEL11375.1 hypothetical protein FY550_09645 [Kushneria phosphatilytica]
MNPFRRRSRQPRTVVEADLTHSSDDMEDIPNLITLSDLKRRQQRIEWRMRQEHFKRYGVAPGPTIIRHVN